MRSLTDLINKFDCTAKMIPQFSNVRLWSCFQCNSKEFCVWVSLCYQKEFRVRRITEGSCSSGDCSKNHSLIVQFIWRVSHSDWIAWGTIFFSMEHGVCCCLREVQGGDNSSLVIWLAVYILCFSCSCVSNICVKVVSQLLFWFSGTVFSKRFFLAVILS